MKTITTNGSLLAIVAGAAFTYGLLRIIDGEPMTCQVEDDNTPVSMAEARQQAAIDLAKAQADAASAKRQLDEAINNPD